MFGPTAPSKSAPRFLLTRMRRMRAEN